MARRTHARVIVRSRNPLRKRLPLVGMFVAQAAGVPVLVTIGLTLAIAGAAISRLVRAVRSSEWTDAHMLAIFSGVLGFWALIAVLGEFLGDLGMSVVAVVTVAFLFRLRRRVRAWRGVVNMGSVMQQLGGAD